MSLITGIVLFILGAMIGSFLAVCIVRLPQGRSVMGGSHCLACDARLNAAELIPILSYVFLRGKCRRCGARISLLFPVTELMTGLLFLLLYLRYESAPAMPVYAMLLCILIVISAIDFKHLHIPGALIRAGFILGVLQLLASILLNTLNAWYEYAIGFIAGGLPLLLIAFVGQLLIKKDTVGGGDIKLMAFCGLVLGWRLIVTTYFIGIVAAALYVIALLAMKRKKRGDEIALAPFLSLGAAVSMFFGDALIGWYIGAVV